MNHNASGKNLHGPIGVWRDGVSTTGVAENEVSTTGTAALKKK